VGVCSKADTWKTEKKMVVIRDVLAKLTEFVRWNWLMIMSIGGLWC